MKKFLLASAFALLATPAMFAQSGNTYSMQIELRDGTKITLGPNDLKNISFSDGAIKIEGNTIEELKAAIAAQGKELDTHTYEMQKQVANIQAQIATLEQVVANLKQSDGGNTAETDAKIAALTTAIEALKAQLNATMDDVVSLNKAMLADVINEMVKKADLDEALSGMANKALLEKAMDDMTSKTKSMLAEVMSEMVKKDDMYNMYGELYSKYEMLTDSIVSLRSSILALTGGLNGSTSQADIDMINVKIADLASVIVKMEAEIKAYEPAIAALQAKAETELAQLKEDVTALNERQKELAKQHDVAKLQDILNASYEMLTDSIASLRSSIKALGSAASDGATDADIKQLRSDIETLSARLVNLEAQATYVTEAVKTVAAQEKEERLAAIAQEQEERKMDRRQLDDKMMAIYNDLMERVKYLDDTVSRMQGNQ